MGQTEQSQPAHEAPTSPVDRGASPGRSSVSDRPRQSSHSEVNPFCLPGRHSIDATMRQSIEPRPTAEKRRHSLPALDESQLPPPSPPPPPPTHPPTNVQSSRQRTVRSSAEFDRRFDGPFARRSIGMSRRRSSQQPRPSEHFEFFELQEEGVAAETASAPQLLEPEPPPLNFTLKGRYMAIFIFWTFIVFDSVVMPIALYFGLWYGVGPGSVEDDSKEIMSANTVFSIVTAALGGASIVEYFVRFWRLYKKGSTCRVIGARRWYLDAFHWNYTLAWLIIMVELIVGTAQYWPPIRLVAMPLTTMLYTFGTEMLMVDLLRLFHVPAPCRLSSIPRGAQLRPCVYTIIEDICAVDGSGETAFREALNRRYEASHVFRTMLRRLGIFWACGAEGMAVVCTVLIFTVSDDAAYAVGWSVPFAWAGVWAMCTIWYVKSQLKREKVAWAEEAAKCTA